MHCKSFLIETFNS